MPSPLEADAASGYGQHDEHAEQSSASVLGRVQRWLATTTGTVVTIAGVFLLTWPVKVVDVEPGLDFSYKAALNMASERGLRFGVDFIYTHGPLGFLNQPTFVDPSRGLLAIFAAVIVNLALVVAVVMLLRREFSPITTIVLSLLVLTLGMTNQVTQVIEVLVVFWAILLLVRPPTRHRVAEIALVGATAGFAVVVKTDFVVVIVLAGYAIAVSALVDSGWITALRQLGVFAASAIAGFGVSWIAAGQELADLGSYARASAENALGYSAAMGIESRGTARWAAEYLVGAILVGLFLFWTARSRTLSPATRRLGLVGFLVLLFFAELKYSFVRHDGHGAKYFVTAAVVCIALLPIWGRRRALIGLGISLVALGLMVQGGRLGNFDPKARVDAFREVAELTASSGARHDYIDDARETLRKGYRIPPKMVERLRGHSVHIAPNDAAVAFAYPSMDWSPLPTVQAFTAYTPYLDDLDADRLTGRDRPEFVLRRIDMYSTVDRRLVRFESPRATFELFCHYREVDQIGRWQLLETSGNRCGEPRQLAARGVRLGETVDVPVVDDALVVARFHGLGTSVFDKLRGLAWKPREFYLETGGIDYRYPTGNQGQFHVLSTPTCAPLGDLQAERQMQSLKLSDRLAIPKLDAADNSYEIELWAVPYQC